MRIVFGTKSTKFDWHKRTARTPEYSNSQRHTMSPQRPNRIAYYVVDFHLTMVFLPIFERNASHQLSASNGCTFGMRINNHVSSELFRTFMVHFKWIKDKMSIQSASFLIYSLRVYYSMRKITVHLFVKNR